MLNDILKILEHDAQTTPRQIAEMTGKSQAEVSKLVKQALKDRTILKYKAIINWDQVDDEQVWAEELRAEKYATDEWTEQV